MRTRLTTSIPYWLLIAASLASVAGGAVLLLNTLGTMTTTLTDGTATGVDVYVGQMWAVVGAILLGTGIVGMLLTLTVTVARSFVPTADPVVEVVEPAAWSDDDAPSSASETAASDRTDLPEADDARSDLESDEVREDVTSR